MLTREDTPPAPTAARGAVHPAARARRIGGGKPPAAPAPAETDAPPPLAAEVARASKAGRNLPAAIGVGLALGALIIASPVRLPAELRGDRRCSPSAYGSYELAKAIGTTGVRVALLPRARRRHGDPGRRVGARPRGACRRRPAHRGCRCCLAPRRRRGAVPADVGSSLFVLLYVPALAGFAVLSRPRRRRRRAHPRLRRHRRVQRHRRLRDGSAVRQAPARADRVEGQDLGGLRRLGAVLLQSPACCS